MREVTSLIFSKSSTTMKKCLSISLLIIMMGTFAFACAGTAPMPVKSKQSQASPQSSTPAPLPEGNSPLIEKLPVNESSFILRSAEAVEGGTLPKEYNCDGNSATLPLEWSNVPAGTKSLAIVMYTIPGPNESHWYWVLYNIPPDTQSLAKNVSGVGTPGNNSVNGKTSYAPPCSKGPGAKKYTYTLYALSAPPQFSVSPIKVSRDVLLSAIKDRILGIAELNVYYSR
jgi:Raf kinase inhibitor-like YbhB/YbcL family protein